MLPLQEILLAGRIRYQELLLATLSHSIAAALQKDSLTAMHVGSRPLGVRRQALTSAWACGLVHALAAAQIIGLQLLRVARLFPDVMGVGTRSICLLIYM